MWNTVTVHCASAPAPIISISSLTASSFASSRAGALVREACTVDSGVVLYDGEICEGRDQPAALSASGVGGVGVSKGDVLEVRLGVGKVGVEV